MLRSYPKIRFDELYSVQLPTLLLLFIEFFLRHLRHTICCKVEPFTQEDLSVFRFAIAMARSLILMFGFTYPRAVLRTFFFCSIVTGLITTRNSVRSYARPDSACLGLSVGQVGFVCFSRGPAWSSKPESSYSRSPMGCKLPLDPELPKVITSESLYRYREILTTRPTVGILSFAAISFS